MSNSKFKDYPVCFPITIEQEERLKATYTNTFHQDPTQAQLYDWFTALMVTGSSPLIDSRLDRIESVINAK